MARTAIPIQTLPRNGAIANVSWTAADAVNGHEFRNGGKVVFLAKNTDAAAHNATVKSVADEAGRTGDIAIAIPATSGYSIAGPFRPAWFNQRAAADLGKVFVDIDVATGVSFAAVQFEE